MFNKNLLIFLLFNGVLNDGPDECVRYYFDHDYDVLFTKDPQMCGTFPTSWKLGSYENSTFEAPNDMSKLFIKASYTGRWDCTSSFLFTMMPNFLLEVNFYLETVTGDRLQCDAVQFTPSTEVHRVVGMTNTPVATTGWHVLNVTMNPNGFNGYPPYQGYLRFYGWGSRNSVIIVDSFRYVPSWMNPETECILYEDLPTISTTTSTTTTTTPTTTTTTPTTTPETTPDTTPTTTSTTPKTTPSKNLTNYFVQELVDFRKSVRFYKRKTTKVLNFDQVEQPPLGLE